MIFIHERYAICCMSVCDLIYMTINVFFVILIDGFLTKSAVIDIILVILFLKLNVTKSGVSQFKKCFIL